MQCFQLRCVPAFRPDHARTLCGRTERNAIQVQFERFYVRSRQSKPGGNTRQVFVSHSAHKKNPVTSKFSCPAHPPGNPRHWSVARNSSFFTLSGKFIAKNTRRRFI